MLGSLSFQEIAFILVLALLIFGPRKLPEMGKMLGRAMGEFRKASSELRRTFNTEISLDEDEREATPRRLADSRSKSGAAGAASQPRASAPPQASDTPREPQSPADLRDSSRTPAEPGPATPGKASPQPQGAVARGDAEEAPSEPAARTEPANSDAADADGTRP